MTNDELQRAADTEADACIRYLSSLPAIEIRNRISNALRNFYVAGVEEGQNTGKLSLVPRRTVE
jgi:hypothetical protein